MTSIDKLRFLSAADTIHDFKSLDNNVIYKTYKEYILIPAIQRLRNRYGYYQYSRIEDSILYDLENDFAGELLNNANDAKPHILYPNISYSHFTKNNFEEKIKNRSIDGKSFVLDLNLPVLSGSVDYNYIRLREILSQQENIFEGNVLKHILAQICSSVSNNNINFIIDNTPIAQNLYCNFKTIDNPSKIIISEAKYYDSTTNNIPRLINCKNDNKTPPIILSKASGNLFSFDSFILKNNGRKAIDGIFQYMYNYNYNGVVFNGSENINLETYKNQYMRTTDNTRSYKKIIENIILYHMRLSDTRPFTLITKDLIYDTNIKKIERIYKIAFINEDSIYDNNIIIYFIGMLFDLKRVGDQLQVETANKTNGIFITEDKIASAYAYLKGVPCIRMKLDYLVFYNFNNKKIIKKIRNIKNYNDLINISYGNVPIYSPISLQSLSPLTPSPPLNLPHTLSPISPRRRSRSPRRRSRSPRRRSISPRRRSRSPRNTYYGGLLITSSPNILYGDKLQKYIQIKLDENKKKLKALLNNVEMSNKKSEILSDILEIIMVWIVKFTANLDENNTKYEKKYIDELYNIDEIINNIENIYKISNIKSKSLVKSNKVSSNKVSSNKVSSNKVLSNKVSSNKVSSNKVLTKSRAIYAI